MKFSKKSKVLAILAGLYIAIYISISALGLNIAFDYDDTISFSTPAFKTGFSSGEKAFSKPFWEIVNGNYKLEKTKKISTSLAILSKLLGFKVYIITARKNYNSTGLVNKWKWLFNGFYFEKNKRKILSDGNWVAFFGDSDSDIEEAQAAGIIGIRIRRSALSSYKDNNHPGKYNECVVPFSDH